jgi:hypothetical protein
VGPDLPLDTSRAGTLQVAIVSAAWLRVFVSSLLLLLLLLLGRALHGWLGREVGGWRLAAGGWRLAVWHTRAFPHQPRLNASTASALLGLALAMAVPNT